MANVSVASSAAEPSFAELLEASFARDEVTEGEIVRGTIISVHKDHVLVDVGFKSEGMVALNEFPMVNGQVSVKSGDSVERIIKKYWADLPFKEVHLRHIIFILNPKAMRAENAKSFVGGTTVLIPSASYLRSSLLTSKQNPIATQAPDPAANEVGGDIDQTKDWVRFP